jgi:hypothetical protein
MPCLRIPVKVAGGSERSDAGKFMMKQGATFHRNGLTGQIKFPAFWPLIFPTYRVSDTGINGNAFFSGRVPGGRPSRRSIPCASSAARRPGFDTAPETLRRRKDPSEKAAINGTVSGMPSKTEAGHKKLCLFPALRIESFS